MPSHHCHSRYQLTGNQIYPTGKNSGNKIGKIGKNLNSSSQPTNQHTLARSQSAQADFVAERSGALRRGFNRPLPTADHISGNTTGKISGNKIGKTGNIAHPSLHNAIPGHTSVSAIGNHRKKRNRGKNGNAHGMPQHPIIPSYTPSANLTGKHSGKKPATIPATLSLCTPLPAPGAEQPQSAARGWGEVIPITARLARVKNEKMRNSRHILVRCPHPAPA